MTGGRGAGQPTFISLFAGIGGLDLGLERAGFTCVAQVEKDKQASAILARHYPNVERFGKVEDVGRNNLPAVDLVCGGFPCTDVSVAGGRAGLAGKHSGLWFEFHRILIELRPQFCVIENVPGLLSSNEGKDFAVILRGLVECGYRVAWRILDAQYFGVAQRRRRVFIVGSLGDGRAAEILFERESGSGHSSARREARKGTSASTSSSATLNHAFGQTGQGYWQNGIQTLRARDYKEPTNIVVGALTPGAHPGGANGQDAYTGHLITAPLADSGAGTARTGNERTEADMLVVEAIDVRNSRSNGAISGTLQAKENGSYSLNYQNPIAIHAIDLQQVTSAANRSQPTEESPPLTTKQRIVAFTQNEREEVRDLGNVAGALASEPGAHQQNYIAFSWQAGAKSDIAAGDVTPTLSSTRKTPAGQRASSGVRRLTPTECERLQGFPDGWTAGQADSSRYRQLGNAVAVPVAEWIAHRLMTAIDAAAESELTA